MGMPGPIGVIDGAVSLPGRQRPCQHGVSRPVIAGRGREVALPDHRQGRDHGNQTRRNTRSGEPTGERLSSGGHGSHGASLRLVTVLLSSIAIPFKSFLPWCSSCPWWFNPPRKSGSFFGQEIESIGRHPRDAKKFHPVFRLASIAFLDLLIPPATVQSLPAGF
jgi:hypothetical protein